MKREKSNGLTTVPKNRNAHFQNLFDCELKKTKQEGLLLGLKSNVSKVQVKRLHTHVQIKSLYDKLRDLVPKFSVKTGWFTA